MNELVQDSHGSIESNYIFQREILTTFKPTTTGEYVYTISNQGPSSVSVDGIFGYIRIIGENNEVNLSPLGGIVAGVILVIIGNIALIVGIVIVIMDKKGKTRSLAG